MSTHRPIYAQRKRGWQPARPRASPPTAVRWPTWRELARTNQPAERWAPEGSMRLPVRRLLAYVLLAALAFTLYVGHVYATRAALEEVQRLRSEQLQLVLRYNRLRGELDRATSPAVIYERARALGLTEGFTYGPVVIHANP